jgi:hypothetical protein
MPALGLLPGGSFPDYNNLPPALPLVNMYVEEAPTEPAGFILLSRPPLGNTIFGSPTHEYGAGPIRAIYRQDGVLGGDVVALSGSDLYVDGVNVGTVPGSDVPSIAGNEMGIVVTSGDDAKFYDAATTTFRSIAFPDGAKVTKVLEQQGRFIFLRKGSHKYYWTLPLSNMIDMSGDLVIDGADFASAENEPDQLLDAIVFQDHLVLGGANTIELHGVTLNDDLPWSPTIGSTIQTGVRGTGCLTNWGNTFAWISTECAVFAGTGRNRISDLWIETLISEATTPQLDSFTYVGLEFLRVRRNDADLVFHNSKWAKWTTNSDIYANGFIGGPTYMEGGLLGFGSNADGKTLVPNFGGIESADDFERLFRFGLPLDGGAVPFHNVFLRCTKAIDPDSVIEMRYSRDGGYSWSNWLETPLGDTGEYRTKVEWRSLGMMDQPGFLAECRVLNGDNFGVSAAYFNEPMMGRSK